MIPTNVHQNTVAPGTSAKPRPVETINAPRSPGGEVPVNSYAGKANSADNRLKGNK